MFPRGIFAILLTSFLSFVRCQTPTLLEDCFQHCANGRYLLPLSCGTSGACHELCKNDTNNACKCTLNRGGFYKMPCQSYYTKAWECNAFCTQMDINRPAKCENFPNVPEVDRCNQLCAKDKRDLCKCGKYPGPKYEVECPAETVKTLKCDEFCEKYQLRGSLAEQICEDLPPEGRRECYLTCTSAGGCNCKTDNAGRIILTCPYKPPTDEKARSTRFTLIVVGVVLVAALLIITLVVVVKCSIYAHRRKLRRQRRAQRQLLMQTVESRKPESESPSENLQIPND